MNDVARGDECADCDRDDGSDSEPPDDDATIEANDGGGGGGGGLIAAGEAAREAGCDVAAVAVLVGRAEAWPRACGGCTATESGGATDDAVSAVVKCRIGQSGVSENR